MCENLDLKNYVDVMKLDACCKRRDTFKLVGIEVKETSATPSSSSSFAPTASSSSSSCTSKKHVSIAGHGRADGSRSLDNRNTKTEVKVVKGILRSKEREPEETAKEASLRKDGGPGKENELVIDECGRFPGGLLLEDCRRMSASINRKGTQAELENATCSAHGMKTISSLQSDGGRGGLWGSVKAVKVSPPRMKRRKKKTSQVASSSAVTVPRTETRQSRLAALLANRTPKDVESESVFRRRSPPRPTAVRIDTTATPRTVLDSNDSPMFEPPRIDGNRLALTLTGSDASHIETVVQKQPEVKGEEGLSFRGHTSAIQSSPDFTSDDTDGGGKDSGYVTMEELQAQLLARSSSSGDEKEVDCDPSTGRQGHDPMVEAVGERAVEQAESIRSSPQFQDSSLLQFTFTVKLDSSLVRRRQLSLASRGLTAEELKNGGSMPPVVAGKVDVVVSQFTKMVDQTRAESTGSVVQRSDQVEDTVDGGFIARDSGVGRSRTSNHGELEKCQLEKAFAAALSHHAAGTHESKRTKKASESSSDEVTRSVEIPDGSDRGYLGPFSPGGFGSQKTGSKTGRAKAAQKDPEEETSAKATPDVTLWDVGTYLRPVGSRSPDGARGGGEAGTRSEVIHMSWQEVVAEAQRLGIPLDIPRQRRGRTTRQGWADQRRSTASCDSSAESDGSLEEEEEDDEDEGEGGRGGRGERRMASRRKTNSGASANRFGQSCDQGAVLLKTRRTLKELLKMRNPFFGRSKKKKSRKQQKSQREGRCCCCDDSPPSASANRRRCNRSSDDMVATALSSASQQQQTTSGTTLLRSHSSQKSATCCRSSSPQPCDKLAPRRPQYFDEVDGLPDGDGRDEVDLGPPTPVTCDGGMLTKHKDAQSSTTGKCCSVSRREI